jgi:hypothetical protein
MMFCNRNEEMMVEKCPPRVVETKYGGAMMMLKEKAKTTPTKERSSTELRFASFPARL